MAMRIVDDGTGSGQSEKKYTFSFELTKPQHTVANALHFLSRVLIVTTNTVVPPRSRPFYY